MNILFIVNKVALVVAIAAAIYVAQQIFSDAKRVLKDKELSAAVVSKLENKMNSKSFIIEELVQQGFTRPDVERKVDEIFSLMNSTRISQEY